MIAIADKKAAKNGCCFRCGNGFAEGDPVIVKHGKVRGKTAAGEPATGEISIAFHPACATEWSMGLGADLYMARKSGINVMGQQSAQKAESDPLPPAENFAEGLDLGSLTLGTGDAPKGAGE